MIKIKESNIPDVNIENIDVEKVNLSNKIIKNVYPIFNDILEDKQKNIIDLKKKFINKKDKIKENKTKLENLIKSYNTKKKLKKLIHRIGRLVNSGLTFDSSMKHEMIVLLKVLPKLSDEKIEEHMNNTIKLINKRFSKQ